jgi:AraC-like DNA-binding protein
MIGGFMKCLQTFLAASIGFMVGCPMVKANTETPRGVLNRKAGEAKFQLTRYQPSPDLAFFVLRHWMVQWDLRGQEPYVQENLPYPCVNMVIEKDKSSFYGVSKGKYASVLKDSGRVFGVKFRPGGFYPFVKTALSAFTDSAISFQQVFGVDGQALEDAVLSTEDVGQMITLAEDFLRQRLPEPDENVRLVNQIVDLIIADRQITKVDDLMARINLNKRTLQRLFSQYVGVSPKWVIQQYRLHEAAEQLVTDDAVDMPKIAHELGYFDQAHFIKDFKTTVGRTPAEYARQAASSPDDERPAHEERVGAV